MKGLNKKKLNIYLASSFRYISRCNVVAKELLVEGHYIPDIWWNIDSKESGLSDVAWYSLPQTKAIAARHFKQIEKSDALVLVCPINEEGSFNGANVEVGYALAKGVPVYSIGNLARSAMYSDVIQCDTIDELLDCLKIQALSER